MRRYLAVVTTLALAMPLWARPTMADQAAMASTGVVTPAAQAQDLAHQAMMCIRRAEDAPDEAAELAEFRAGVELARRALALDDGNAQAHFALFANEGSIMLRQGVTVNPVTLLKANRELERTLEIDPQHADGLAAKGGMYHQLPWVLGGSLDKAQDYLERSLKIDPGMVGARIELAETYRDKGQPERGVPLLERAIEIAESQSRRRKAAEARALLAQLRAAK